MRKSLSLLLLFLLIRAGSSIAQKPGKDSTVVNVVDGALASDGTRFAPNVTPPSPQATSFQRYGDFPVGHTTGVPEINIPIYTINTGKLKLPINISYHAGGFKPRDNSGPVGLGWSISTAGWRISRTAVADADELSGTPSPVMSGSSLAGTTTSSADAAKRLYQLRLFADESASGTDMQPDIFNYGLPSGGGKFLLKKLFDASGTYTGSNIPVTVPYRPIKITSNNTTFNSGFTYFQIVDEDGVTYRYGLSMDNVDVTETTYPNQHDAGRSFKTSWLLTDVISQGGKEHIKLKYKTGIYHTSSSRTDVGSIKSADIGFGGVQTIPNSVTYDPTSTAYPYISVSQGITTSTHYVALIESIEFNNGKVLFGYETSESTPTIYDGYKLKNVEVYNSDNKLIQKHSFTQANYTGDTKRYKLTKLERFGLPAGTANETHSFDYTEPPTPAPNNPVDLKGIDYWGFYNEKNTNGTLVPGFYKIQAFASSGAFTYYTTGSADRTANPVPTKYYVIRKITFPTGGTTEFEFEGNKVNWASVATNAGGLRVARIINTVEGVQEIKTYEYGGDGCAGCGSIRLNPFQLESFFTMGYTHKEIDLVGGCTPDNNYLIKVSSDIVDGSSYFETSPVLYSTVTEHIGSSATANQGKTVYKYDQPSLVFADTPYARYLSTVDYWKGSNLKEKETFAYGAGSYATIRKETYNYNKVLRDTLPSQYIEPFAIDADTGEPSFAYLLCGHGQNAFRIFDYRITTGVAQLSDKTVISDGVTTTETYQYPANYNVPKLSTFTNSEGQSFETSYTYPFDVPAYSAMVTANIVNPVVTQTVKEGTMARLTRTDFGCASGSWGTSSPCIYVPTQVSTQRISGGVAGTLYPEITFNSYNDRGYPTQYTERNGLNTILDWSSAAGSVNLLTSMTTGAGSALAQTSSWTYEPLVGSKTSTGLDGKVLYYEYDAFNRLKNIRNAGASGGIRNSYCYNYYGQTLSECTAIAATGTVSPANIALIPEINDGPLPVTLVSFSAVREGSVALLNWNTTAETNSERFDIERGQNGKTWSKLGSVTAAGESSSTKHYDFSDRFPTPGENLYRLKMVDRDGTYAYSRIQSLRFDGNVAVYPNPLVMGDKLHLDTSVSGPIKNVRIYDIQGKLVFSGEPVGNTIQTNNLSVGVYMVHLIGANGTATVHRVIKQ